MNTTAPGIEVGATPRFDMATSAARSVVLVVGVLAALPTNRRFFGYSLNSSV